MIFKFFKKRTKETDDKYIIPFPFEEIRADADWPVIMARFFSTSEGRRVLQYLRYLVMSRAVSPEMSEANLRFEAGRRSFYTQICNLIKQGCKR
tara:strand:- start:126 stop:407 length:282 start_codon:yes stop_codon:yes gene_type:complete